jgi:hypothetical protein
LEFDGVESDGKTDLCYYGKYGPDAKSCWRMHISDDEGFRTEIWARESAYFGRAYQSRQLLTGDFNGDGKTDLAYLGKHGNSGEQCWRMHISTGSSFNTEIWAPKSAYFGYNRYKDGRIINQTTQLLTGDFNGDGKTDIAYLGMHGSKAEQCWRMHFTMTRLESG